MTEPPPRLTVGDVAVLVFLAAASFVIVGFCFGREDHAMYLPFLYSYIRPELFENDLLLEALPSHHTFFWMLLALPARVVSVRGLFFVLQLASTVLMAFAVFYFSMGLFHDRGGAALVVALFVVQKGMLGL